MEALAQIAIILMAVAMVVIAVFFVKITNQLIPTLKQIEKTSYTIEETLKSMESQLKLLIEETEQTMKDISEITASMKSQVGKIENSMENFRALIDRSHKLSVMVYEQIEFPIVRVLDNIKAIQSGCKTFFNVFTSHRKEG